MAAFFITKIKKNGPKNYALRLSRHTNSVTSVDEVLSIEVW